MPQASVLSVQFSVLGFWFSSEGISFAIRYFSSEANSSVQGTDVPHCIPPVLPAESRGRQRFAGAPHPYWLRIQIHSQPAAAGPLLGAPSPPDAFRAASAEEDMRKNKTSILVLLLALTFSVSCSRLGAPSDDAIATDIKAKMFSEPALKNAAVDVSSKGGVITLTGQVPDDAARLAAYKIATEAKGVTKVNEQMSVVAAQAAAPELAVPAATPAPEPAARPAKPRRASSPARSREAASATEPAQAAAAAPAPPPPPQPVTVTVPANTVVTIRTVDSIDSKTNHAGEVFKA